MVIWSSSDNWVIIIFFVILDVYDLTLPPIFPQFKKKKKKLYIHIILSFANFIIFISPCKRLIKTVLVEWKYIGNERERNPVNDEPK